jgi:hypothetical protein
MPRTRRPLLVRIYLREPKVWAEGVAAPDARTGRHTRGRLTGSAVARAEAEMRAAGFRPAKFVLSAARTSPAGPWDTQSPCIRPAESLILPLPADGRAPSHPDSAELSSSLQGLLPCPCALSSSAIIVGNK